MAEPVAASVPLPPEPSPGAHTPAWLAGGAFLVLFLLVVVFAAVSFARRESGATLQYVLLAAALLVSPEHAVALLSRWRGLGASGAAGERGAAARPC